MAWLYERVAATGRVEFVNGTAEKLETDGGRRVTGVRLKASAEAETEAGKNADKDEDEDEDGGNDKNNTNTNKKTLTADLIIAAAGAWTPTLLDLSSQAVATGQIVGYVDISEAEQAELGRNPVVLDLTRGHFIIPPRGRVLKVARHSYGYLNPTRVEKGRAPLGRRRRKYIKRKEGEEEDQEEEEITISQPWTHLSDPDPDQELFGIPPEGEAALREALRLLLPNHHHRDIASRPFRATRLCWYTDTATGDWIVDYHGSYDNLFVATGGSGHAFKFLPVLGGKVVECIMGRCPPEFRDKWRWRGGLREEENREQDVEKAIATEDGSRGGKPGLVLKEQMARRL
ncbi:FAD dependent oxidoreductase-domain-containing protein [Xylariomycetidae sp. FL2044]|nr:FAD dependent oxidoreductase-domain-containing protein [Xylariomycetidae sp. FL2044]